MEDVTTKAEMSDEDKFLALALERFKKIYDAEYNIREASLEDLRFVYNVENGQWPEDIIQQRKDDSRPCLTFNKLRKFVSQVANFERENRFGSRVRPVDDKADVDRAKIIEGLIRQIENASMADEIYSTAGEKAIAGGFGYWRILTKEQDDSFNQEIFIALIENQFSVYLDPDRNYGFIREGLTKKEFENRYPGKAMSNFSGGLGEEYQLWYKADKVFIAEYFYKERYDKTIAEVQNIQTGETAIIELKKEDTPELLFESGKMILRQKTKKATRIKWAKISALQILEQGEWAGSEIPIIEIKGDNINIGGINYKRSLVRDSKDPQRMFNYWLTHITESGALIPKSPYIVFPQEIKGFEGMWADANRKNYPYLLVNPHGSGKKPYREPPPQIQTGAVQLLMLADTNIDDTMGLYEASRGERSNERTGVAINARSSRSIQGVFHFHDNYRRAILETTRQLIEIIPKIYDTERIERILGEEGIDMTVKINEEFIDPNTGVKIIKNDLTVGKYDVVADVRLFATRRQEAAQVVAEYLRSAPNVAPLVLPFLFKWQDWPDADKLQAQVEKYLPQLMGQKGEQTGTPENPGLSSTL